MLYPTAKELRNKARNQLSSKGWEMPIGVSVLEMIILSATTQMLLASLFLTGPFKLGSTRCYLDYTSRGDMVFEDMFSGFKNFARALVVGLLNIVFVALWGLLFIIPGIVKKLAYSLVYFVLNDEPTLSARDALRKSEEIMRGHKWRLFCLKLSFLGWWILTVLTLGVLIIWVEPYMRTTMTYFYQDLKDRGEA